MPDEYYNTVAQSYNELHEQEQLRKLEIIKSKLIISKETKLLDVGCGSGISSQFDCDVTGIDPSEELLKLAAKRMPTAQFMTCKAEALPFEDKSFDVVVSLTAIQNFDDIDKGLSEIKRVGKKLFALTFLKKSEKSEMIENLIKKIFPKVKKIEEEKDFIFIMN